MIISSSIGCEIGCRVIHKAVVPDMWTVFGLSVFQKQSLQETQARLKPVINARQRVQKTGRNIAAKGEYNLDERSSVALSENLQK